LRQDLRALRIAPSTGGAASPVLTKFQPESERRARRNEDAPAIVDLDRVNGRRGSHGERAAHGFPIRRSEHGADDRPARHELSDGWKDHDLAALELRDERIRAVGHANTALREG